ncbi:MAG: LytTR family DNA-binding domain-containing protein [Bacteroidota bacterium]
MQTLLKRLNEPFPEREISIFTIFKDAFSAGLIVGMVLLIIGPKGVDQTIPSLGRLGNTAMFGLITVLITIVYQSMMAFVFKVRSDTPAWNLKKWILTILGLLFFIAIGNFVYINLLYDWQAMSWSNLLNMGLSTFTVGIFPILFFGFTLQRKAIDKNEQEASEIQSNLQEAATSHQMILLQSQNGKQQLELEIGDLFYAEAMQNYVAIHFQNGEKKQKELLRNTIASIEQQLAASSIIRCHRSYLVNLDLIEKVEGNAQGLRLQLKGLPDTQVPVSRKYIPTLRAAL